MSDYIIIVLVGLLTMGTHFLEGIAGFGATVLTMPFAIQLIGIKAAVPVLSVQSLILAAFVIITDFKNIIWREYVKITLFMGLGMPFGIYLFSILPNEILKKILGLFMILVAVRGLYYIFKSNSAEKTIKQWILYVILFLGGIIHGAFGTGGPLAIIYASQVFKDKRNFRATMCTLWFTLNTVLTLTKFQSGDITLKVGRIILYTFPFLLIGIIIGNFTHHRIKNSTFSKLIYILMGLSGIFMITV